jgi:prepilin-type N-terminal cleavage/methylation domain-containing protein
MRVAAPRPTGFTLVELITVLVLVGVIGTALYQLLINNQRVYREQAERIQLNENARAAISVLPADVRELNAADTAGSDLVALGPSSLSYKAMRGLYLLCRAPDGAAARITVDNTRFFGLRRLDPEQDSVLVFAEHGADLRSDDAWLHGDVLAAVPGTGCPGGTPSLELQLAGVTPAQLAAVTPGAPVRSFEVTQVLLYRDAGGDQWLGGRTYRKRGGGWSVTQPIVGPLSAGGLALEYFDAEGRPTADPADVARIGISVQSRSGRRVRGGDGDTYLLQTLMTQVSLRNNPRP